MPDQPIKPIECPVCDSAEYEYHGLVAGKFHNVKCKKCGWLNVVHEQQLLDADPAFQVWLDNVNDAKSEAQNKKLRGQWS